MERLYQEVSKDIAQAASPADQLLVYVQASIKFFRKQPYFLELVQRIEMSGQKDKIAMLEECRRRFFRLAAGMIKECQAAAARTARNGAARNGKSRKGKGQNGRASNGVLPLRTKFDPALAALALTGMIRQILRFHPRPFAKDLPGWIVRQFLHGLE